MSNQCCIQTPTFSHQIIDIVSVVLHLSPQICHFFDARHLTCKTHSTHLTIGPLSQNVSLCNDLLLSTLQRCHLSLCMQSTCLNSVNRLFQFSVGSSKSVILGPGCHSELLDFNELVFEIATTSSQHLRFSCNFLALCVKLSCPYRHFRVAHHGFSGMISILVQTHKLLSTIAPQRNTVLQVHISCTFFRHLVFQRICPRLRFREALGEPDLQQRHFFLTSPTDLRRLLETSLLMLLAQLTALFLCCIEPPLQDGVMAHLRELALLQHASCRKRVRRYGLARHVLPTKRVSKSM
mmetsp:Transcript_65175/g.172676  ORF Transcript_65175/g.172676 Transcript_65175/m.172676 type:complete len:294 (+) Transcript_65175:791-1672(+)